MIHPRLWLRAAARRQHLSARSLQLNRNLSRQVRVRRDPRRENTCLRGCLTRSPHPTPTACGICQATAFDKRSALMLTWENQCCWSDERRGAANSTKCQRYSREVSALSQRRLFQLLRARAATPGKGPPSNVSASAAARMVKIPPPASAGSAAEYINAQNVPVSLPLALISTMC